MTLLPWFHDLFLPDAMQFHWIEISIQTALEPSLTPAINYSVDSNLLVAAFVGVLIPLTVGPATTYYSTNIPRWLSFSASAIRPCCEEGQSPFIYVTGTPLQTHTLRR